MKSVCIVACVGVAAAKFPSLPPYASDVALGLIEGLVDQHDDVMQCGLNGVAPVGLNLINAATDFEKALKDRKIGELRAVLDDLLGSCEAIKPMLDNCDLAHSEVMEIIASVKEIKGIKGLISRISGDLKGDIDNIESEADLSFKTFRAEKYQEFGDHLGQLLHRMVIGKFDDDTHATLTSTMYTGKIDPVNLENFALTFISAILNDQPDMMSCVVGGLGILDGFQALNRDLPKVIKDHNMTAVKDVMLDVASMCGAIGPAKTMCDPAYQDAVEIKNIFSEIKGLSGIIEHVKTNIDGDIDNIESEADLSFKSWEKDPKDYSEFGTHVGTFLRRLVIGKYDDEQAVVV